MRNLSSKEQIKKLDEDVLNELQRMRSSGKTLARAGEIARKMGCDSVQALGAMERVKNKLARQEINQ